MPSKLNKWFGKFKKQKKDNSEFLSIWKEHKQIYYDEDNLVCNVFCDVWNRLILEKLEAEKVVNEALQFIIEGGRHKMRNREMLIEIVNILAAFHVPNRHLVRSALQMLYEISRCIDRSVLFFEQADLVKPVSVSKDLLEKQLYILENTAGWMVDGESTWNCKVPIMYLELPFRRASSSANSNVMAEALYRQQDPALVLRLLQHGLQPSCLYLWPTCILIDLKFSSYGPESVESEDITASIEAIMVRYFCRARHYIHVHVVKPEARGEEDPANPMPIGVPFDDVLLIPPSAVAIVPDCRFKHASRLQHQCRLAIRKALLEADNLPRGLEELPLPKPMRDYVNLLTD